MKLIFQIIISAFAVIITSYLLPGIHVSNFITACLVAIVLAVLNNLVKPLLIILTIPITFFTFGLFLLVINAFIIILAGNMVPGFRVDGFWWALAFSIILSIVSSILASVNREDNME
ncbi:MAG TPA: phage holin family protein [Bacteroidales bacterium]|nr:phage holin family protein [Bacteroidales bacterium]HQI46947.1 phage holin family protein [Bacteroidales bacterium]